MWCRATNNAFRSVRNNARAAYLKMSPRSQACATNMRPNSVVSACRVALGHEKPPCTTTTGSTGGQVVEQDPQSPAGSKPTDAPFHSILTVSGSNCRAPRFTVDNNVTVHKASTTALL